MLKLGKERDSLSVVNDQIGSPTYTKDLVEIIKLIVSSQDIGPRVQGDNSTENLEPDTQDPGPKPQVQSPVPYGTYHFSGQDSCSWYNFAKEIFRVSNIDIVLRPITSDQYPQKAKRPSYSYMSKDKIEQALKFKVRSWQEMVQEYLSNKTRNS